jgi:hypothetical protein
LLFVIRFILQRNAGQFAVVVNRNEGFLRGSETVFRALQNRIAEAMTAAVTIQLRADGLPADVPNGRIIPYIKIVPVDIERIFVVR